MCLHGYYQSVNGFMATHAVGHMMYGYTLLVPMNQKVLNNSSKDDNKTCQKLLMTHRVLKSYVR